MGLALTDAKIRALKPRSKAYKVSDFGGLYLQVTPKGSKLWRWKYRYRGKEGKLSFGPYPDTSLKDARDFKDRARIQLAKGINPAEVKATAKLEAKGRIENSFNLIADRFIDKSRKEGKSTATLKKLAWLLDDARKDFGVLPIGEISPQVVLKTLKKREAMGQYETARRMRSRIGGVFRYAVASGLCENDPTFALQDALIRPQVTHRAAITDSDTLARYINALESYQGQKATVIALWLLMLFACRPGELRLARWDEFDFEARIWNVPATRMKMRRPHSVPLCDKALTLLEGLKTLTGWGALLFPAQSSSKRPISENTLNQALRRMGFGPDEATSHGFRSTFSTFANQSGLWNPDAIEAYCARIDTNATRRAYNRADYWDERVRIADWWARELGSINIQKMDQYGQ